MSPFLAPRAVKAYARSVLVSVCRELQEEHSTSCSDAEQEKLTAIISFNISFTAASYQDESLERNWAYGDRGDSLPPIT